MLSLLSIWYTIYIISCALFIVSRTVRGFLVRFSRFSLPFWFRPVETIKTRPKNALGAHSYRFRKSLVAFPAG